MLNFGMPFVTIKPNNTSSGVWVKNFWRASGPFIFCCLGQVGVTYRLNRTGPRTDPCGQALLIFNYFDWGYDTFTKNSRLVSKSSMSLSIPSGITPLNFPMNVSNLKMLNAEVQQICCIWTSWQTDGDFL